LIYDDYTLMLVIYVNL